VIVIVKVKVYYVGYVIVIHNDTRSTKYQKKKPRTLFNEVTLRKFGNSNVANVKILVKNLVFQARTFTGAK
jgi:hypothetical protein